MKCSEILIYVLCAILLVSACALCSGGLYLAVGFKHMNDNILPKFDDAKAKIRKMIETMNIYPGTFIEDPPNVNYSSPLEDIHFDGIVNGLGYCVLGLSLLMVIVGFTTITGTCKKSTHLWKAGIVVTTVLLVTETITLLLGTSFRESVKDILKTYFQEQMTFSFQSLQSKDSVSIGWNLVMQKFNCCGINGYFDFNGSSSFNETWGQPFHTYIEYNPYQTALACCNTIYIQPRRPRFYGPCYDNDYLTKQGCMDVLWDVVEKYKVFFIAFIVFIMIVQILITVLICLKLQTRRKPNRIGIVTNRSKKCQQNERVNRHDNIGDYKTNEVNIGGSSALHMNKEKSWMQDFNWHLQSSEQRVHYKKDNSWWQDLKGPLQGLEQGTRIENDEFDLKEEKWYQGTRHQPMQRTRRT